MSEDLGYFTAVYRDGRVHIANKSYAAGVYAVHLLNNIIKRYSGKNRRLQAIYFAG